MWAVLLTCRLTSIWQEQFGGRSLTQLATFFMFSLWAIAVVALVSTRRSIETTTTTATCITDLWTFNQEGSSPCLVGSGLFGACDGGNWNVPPLNQFSYYSGPYEDDENKCQCTTVLYSLMWNQWKTNCTASDITIGQFPVTIPSGLSIPSWAYLDVTTLGVWDSAAALANHDSGASDSTVAGSATGNPSSTGTPSSTVTPSSILTPHKTSSQTGAVAGGVAGGLVGLVLIAIAVYALMRRRNTTPQVSIGDGENSGLVDPSDPSTFPNASAPTLRSYVPVAVAPGNVTAYYHPQNLGSLPPNSEPGARYSGVPEVFYTGLENKRSIKIAGYATVYFTPKPSSPTKVPEKGLDDKIIKKARFLMRSAITERGAFGTNGVVMDEYVPLECVKNVAEALVQNFGRKVDNPHGVINSKMKTYLENIELVLKPHIYKL
ncbi:hypothetical protein BU17DRAFT_69881 [Hysterangium stoloniferum]|nr:hypothetical protein BU17DRAFT_69881 [Hysterangium stoloniferum]